MRRSVVALVCGLGVAHAKPPSLPAFTDPLELAARLEGAIRRHDATAIQAMLSDAIVHDGLWFADAACAKRFGTRRGTERPDVRMLARCFAQQKPMLSTRRSSVGVILTFDPGVEVELVFRFDRVTYAGSEWTRDADRGMPTLTVQAFEALRKTGTTQLDAALAGKLAGPASAWIKVCLDKTGAVASTFVAAATPPAAGDAFLAAISDWTFAPFAVRKTPAPACAMSLLSYPASSAPAIEVLPSPSLPVPVERISDDDLAAFDFTGTSINAAPQNVPPTQLEQNRIRGSKLIEPDATTKAAIVKAGRASVLASLKLCVDDKGKVSQVASLKSSGFPDYDVKLEREMRKWAFKPYVVNGAPAAVCTAVTFIYRP